MTIHASFVPRVPSPRKPGKPDICFVVPGSFSPPQDHHFDLIRTTRDFYATHHPNARIEFVMSPVHDGYEKPGLISSLFRLEMCIKAAQAFNRKNNLNVEVSDWEVKQPKYSTTVQVLMHFKKLVDPSTKVYLLCGKDLLDSMKNPSHNWDKVDVIAIFKDYGVCCVDRGAIGSRLFDTAFIRKTIHKNIIEGATLILLDLAPHGMSSSIVRKAFADTRRSGLTLNEFTSEFLRILEKTANISFEEAEALVCPDVIEIIWTKHVYLPENAVW